MHQQRPAISDKAERKPRLTENRRIGDRPLRLQNFINSSTKLKHSKCMSVSKTDGIYSKNPHTQCEEQNQSSTAYTSCRDKTMALRVQLEKMKP